MAFLTDTDIRNILTDQRQDRSKLFISPFEEKSLTPVGYDLRIGDTYTVSDRRSPGTLLPGEKLSIAPGATALILTQEEIRMPEDKRYSGLIESKVSQVSRGLSHISTTVDADWDGRLLIAVHNHSINKVEFTFGDAFCTLVFFENKSPATKNCDKRPDRLDVFMKQFNNRSKEAARVELFHRLIPPSIVLIGLGFGWLAFGNQPGFSGAVAAAVGISYLSKDWFNRN